MIANYHIKLTICCYCMGRNCALDHVQRFMYSLTRRTGGGETTIFYCETWTDAHMHIQAPNLSVYISNLCQTHLLETRIIRPRLNELFDSTIHKH